MSSTNQPPISSMSISDLKRELMDLNDSSFVFSDRDELECALKSARRVATGKWRAGLDYDNGAASSSPEPESNASHGSGSTTTSSFDRLINNNNALTATDDNVAAATAADVSERIGELDVSNNSNKLPDLASVSTASTSRGSSLSKSVSPGPSTRNGAPAAASTAVNEKEASNSSSSPPSSPNRDTATKNIFDDKPSDETEAPISRRLVEYFVMVSCIPVISNSLSKSTAIRLKKAVERPPDPNKDKMNSRTKGRFDVRRVHLSASSSSSVRTADYGEDADNKAGEEGAEFNLGNTLLEPQITARYPPTDHVDQPLNLRLPQFCHPEGTDLLHPTLEYKMPRVHHFVLTDSLGGKQYGTALTVYEEFTEASLRHGSKDKEDGGEDKDDEEGKAQKRLSRKMSNSSLSSSNNLGNKKQKTYYAPRVLVLLSTYPYLTSFRTYLTQLYRLATTTDVMTTPIERYVLNICSEVPAPPPGAFEVELTIHASLGTRGTVKFWAPPADQPIPYVSLPTKVLFECLDIGNILFAWYALACEHKVLLVSSQLSLLTVCAEILTSFLFPMRWSHLYIPVLPRSLCPMLDAPMPYLCGISRENFPWAVEDISDETIVVDLDRNVITLGPNTPDLPALPHNRRKKLEGTLKANVGDVFWEARNLTKADVLRVRASGDEGTLSEMLDKAGAVWEEKVRTRDDAFNLAFAPDSVSLQFDEDANVGLDDGTLPKQSRWDAVQEAFLRFYVSLLQDYRKFLPATEDSGSLQERSTWRGKEGMSLLRYQKEEFVAASPAEFQPFLEELTMTQQFDDFVTRKMHNADDAADIKFFDQSIDAKRNRSKLKLKKKETPFLHSACAHRDLKQVQAVEPNGEDLPPHTDYKGGRKVYMYKTWPLGFDERLFGTPRPIPSIISAEFDRRTALRKMLRSKYGIVDDAPRERLGRNRSPEATTFILFFATFTSVIGKELTSVEQKHGTGADEDVVAFGGPLVPPAGRLGASGNTTRQSLTNLDDDMEVARTIAKAQIDLGYHTLSLMRARKLPPEPIAYKLLIQACGRCKVTHRASGLMEMLARDGLATNSEIYTSLITAFSNDDGGQPSSLALYQMHADDNMSSLSSSEIGSTDRLLHRHASSSTPSEHSLDLISESSPATEITGSSSSNSKKSRIKTPKLSMNKQVFKSVKAKSRRNLGPVSQSMTKKKKDLKVTAAISKQIELGESLLESLYPSIDIDTENVCPKCATVLNEDDICNGWTPCSSNDYQTKCPSCTHKFVPKFSISTKSPTFEGSQGKGTPLYCDHLSPWVLLREIRSVITATGGNLDSVLDEKFRSGSDISATLWWNMVVTFRRYRLPYIFLLQGSFQNQLILPSPHLSESMTDIS